MGIAMKLLHFADAHIDMANYGRHDPQTGLPMRVLDFLKSLDTIIETAIAEKVDVVIFAGDAYKDRTPAPTFQREWGKRIIRLSRAHIPTILLVGNHDVSPSIGRAHAIQEFDTLQIPYVHVISSPRLLTAEQIGLPVQVIGLPWISRSGLLAATETSINEVYNAIETRITQIIETYIEQSDPSLPLILTAHASVQGATYGAERTIMLGADLVLPASLVKDPRFDYVALGHIHKAQNLNENNHPPVIYPGSIERVDFGEAQDDKFFTIAHIQKGQPTQVEWRKLQGIRPFLEAWLRLESPENITQQLKAALPAPEKLKDAIVKLTIDYPRDYEQLIDEAELRRYTAQTFEFHLIKRPQRETRIRLPHNESIATLSPLELLDLYWKSQHLNPAESEALRTLAQQILAEAERLPHENH
ncbi:MAG: exonuclease SbcCD subunit D [Anaerolineae bacterium]|nr:MAG: exonuclease SbcCD subunit D [Anaerolineae bacterium]